MEQTNVMSSALSSQASLIIRPIISEKSMQLAGLGRFTFVVAKIADKQQIRKAIEEQFNVNVLAIQTLIAKGKRGRAGKRRVEIPLSFFKKAIVRLKDGQKIDLFDVQKEEKKSKKEKKVA